MVRVRPVNNGFYRIQNRASGTYLDLNNGDNMNGTKVQGWRRSGTAGAQKWGFCRAFNEGGVDWFIVWNWQSGTVLDLNNGSNRNGTAVQGWDQSKNWVGAQLWRVDGAGGEYFTCVPYHDNVNPS